MFLALCASPKEEPLAEQTPSERTPEVALVIFFEIFVSPEGEHMAAQKPSGKAPEMALMFSLRSMPVSKESF